MKNDSVLRVLALLALLDIFYLFDHTVGARGSRLAVPQEMIATPVSATSVENDKTQMYFVRQDLLNKSGVKYAGGQLVLLGILAAFRMNNIRKKSSAEQPPA